MNGLALFIAASLALIFTPGPDMIYVLTRGMAQGRLAGAVSGVGVTAGILVHTFAASLGLAVLLQTSMLAFWALKIAGGCLSHLRRRSTHSPPNRLHRRAGRDALAVENLLQAGISLERAKS